MNLMVGKGAEPKSGGTNCAAVSGHQDTKLHKEKCDTKINMSQNSIGLNTVNTRLKAVVKLAGLYASVL